MLKTYISQSYELAEQRDLYERTDDQTAKFALAEVLQTMAHFIRLEAVEGKTDMPKSIRVQVVKEGWDLQVLLWPEKEGKDAVS